MLLRLPVFSIDVSYSPTLAKRVERVNDELSTATQVLRTAAAQADDYR